MTEKLWGGRFTSGTAANVEAFTASIGFDWRLYRQDIAGSIVHARMLARQGIIAAEEAAAIVAGLEAIRGEIERGELDLRSRTADEDVHMAVEGRLREKIGEIAGKLHTARSRNDQVALDLRLYARSAVAETVARIAGLQGVLLDLAGRQLGAVLPGYTHLQRAQPVLLSHHLLAYVEMLDRDADRFRAAYGRADVMPLGSGALAGAPYPLDREFVARELGFSRISRNSLDAVSDRDFVLDYEAAASLTMMHLSRLAEEVVVWTTSEFAFLELDDAYATGSSIMPQKKNPDVAELVRGKTGRVYGHLLGLLTTLKGLPLAYNRDLQEDKEGFFDTVDTLLASLEVCAGMLGTAQFRTERMQDAAGAGFLLATDVADYLVGKGIPFRQAHAIVGRLVGDAIGRGKELRDLTLEEYRRFSPAFDADVLAIDARASVEARKVPGGTATPMVEQALADATSRVAGHRQWLEQLPRLTF